MHTSAVLRKWINEISSQFLSEPCFYKFQSATLRYISSRVDSQRDNHCIRNPFYDSEWFLSLINATTSLIMLSVYACLVSTISLQVCKLRSPPHSILAECSGASIVFWHCHTRNTTSKRRAAYYLMSLIHCLCTSENSSMFHAVPIEWYRIGNSIF